MWACIATHILVFSTNSTLCFEMNRSSQWRWWWWQWWWAGQSGGLIILFSLRGRPESTELAKHCHQLQISSQSRHHDDGVFEDFVMLMIYDDIHDFHDYCRGVERVWDGLNKMVFSHPHERKFYPKGTILSLVTNITSGARHMCEILPPLKNDWVKMGKWNETERMGWRTEECWGVWGWAMVWGESVIGRPHPGSNTKDTTIQRGEIWPNHKQINVRL